jgi:hypothetical protein
VVRVKNSFSAPVEERAAQFHLLPLTLTVVVDSGKKFGELMQLPEVRAAVDTYVSTRDPTVPPHRWTETTTRARELLESAALFEKGARLLGELQMVLESHAEVRHKTHEMYTALRFDSAPLLWEYYARAAAVEGEGGVGGVDDLSRACRSLWRAAQCGNRPASEMLLRQMADVNMVANQTTALFQASQKGHTDVVKVLTEANANVDLGDIDDTSTPLFMAVQNGHTDVVKVLVRAHADVNQARATDGSTPLFMAAQDGYIDIVEVLLAAHADVNKARTTDAQRGNAGAAPGSPRLVEEGATPLHVAAQNSHVDVIKMLLAAGADRNKASEKGWTPFKAAKRWGSKEAQDALRPPEAEH